MRLPKTIKAYQNTYKLNYNFLLSENPKTIKSDIKTYILHLAPSNQSGIINVCPSALNCAKFMKLLSKFWKIYEIAL